MDQENQQMAQNSTGGSAKVWAILAGVVVVIAVFAYLLVSTTSTNNTVVQNPVVTPVDTTPTTTPVTTPVPPPVTPPAKKYIYKDGTYSAAGNYNSPGGSEQIGVTVTLANDIITSATVTSVRTSGGQAMRFQGAFISGFKSQVIGKNIANVQLNRVSGASLTPRGWNNAIAQIQTQAKV